MKEFLSAGLVPVLLLSDQFEVFDEEEYEDDKSDVALRDLEKSDFQRDIYQKVLDYRLYLVSWNSRSF